MVLRWQRILHIIGSLQKITHVKCDFCNYFLPISKSLFIISTLGLFIIFFYNKFIKNRRIYSPAIGKFLSVDPLSNKYPWYTSYQFAGNKPIQYVDVDGLEEGKIEVSKTEPMAATLIWKKVYHIVTEGSGMVNNYSAIDERVLNNIYNSGENTIYINRLPGDDIHKSIKLKKEKHWRKGKAYKLTINYDTQVKSHQGRELFVPSDIDPTDKTDYRIRYYSENIDYLNTKILENQNPILNGIISDESKIAKKTLTYPTVAAGVRDDQAKNNDHIITNDEIFGTEGVSATKTLGSSSSLDIDHAVGHEIGHNFGLSHPVGDYSQDGLMNNNNSKIRPTKENNLEIIKVNEKNIKKD